MTRFERSGQQRRRPTLWRREFTMWNRLSWLSLIVVLVLGSSAPAQIVRVMQAGVAGPAEKDDDDEEEENPQQQNQGFAVMDESNFESWVWNGTANSLAAGKTRLETQLNLLVDEITRTCQLTDSQRLRLKLAGEIDMKRFIDRYQKLRQYFLKVRTNPNAMNEIWPMVQPLQTAIQSGLFDESSLFSKSLPRTLNSDQQAVYDRESRDRREYRYHAKLELMIVALDEALGMKSEHRDRLLQLAKQRARIPKRFGQYDSYVVMYELSHIPEEEMRPLFDDSQWKRWQQYRDQYRGMEQFLRQNKLLPEDEPAEKAVPMERMMKAQRLVPAVRIGEQVPADEKPAGKADEQPEPQKQPAGDSDE